ncbi:MAG: hypothetical protein OEU26_04855 [Candidatus Tectomicrobia bacterium]|nr:hypothetical protein [Candidatus Tectomicrobia bacterium]
MMHRPVPGRSTRHRVDMRYRPDDLRALFAAARREDVEVGGRYDVRSAITQIWTHHWRHAATRAESDRMGVFYFRWPTPTTLWKSNVRTPFRQMTCDWNWVPSNTKRSAAPFTVGDG